MFKLFVIDQFGTELIVHYHSREEGEAGAVRHLRQGAVKTTLFDPRFDKPVMVLTQAQLHLFAEKQS